MINSNRIEKYKIYKINLINPDTQGTKNQLSSFDVLVEKLKTTH
jgi:hypothetical protein